MLADRAPPPGRGAEVDTDQVTSADLGLNQGLTLLRSSLSTPARGLTAFGGLGQSVLLEGFEPPTLGSVGTFHNQQLGDSLVNVAQITRKMFTQVHECSTR